MGLSRYLPARLGGALFPNPAAKGERRKQTKRRADAPQRLHIEPLEPRMMLAAAGLVPVGSQPTGPLTGKIVYTSAGHGWQWNSSLNRYATDRGDNNEIVEDFGNQEQMTAYIDYLWRAGATIVPMRPVGRQINEVVLDNDSPGVTFTGAWSNSSSTRYYDEDYGAGAADSVPYRFASTTTGAATATATYTPNIPQAGLYPVYTWVLRGTDRTSQLYRVNHSGGTTEVRVDHSMVGSGWVYLGTYHFEAGSSAASGSVQITNQGAAGKVVIADAIRFGNGMGDSTVSGGPAVSGYPREDENSWHWIARSIGVGTTLATAIGSGTSNVSAPSNFARYMNADTNPFGTSVFISFHSNAGGGRGAVGLIDTDAGDRTPHQADLALYLGRQINQDMQALNGQFEYNWSTRTTHTFTGQFGEIDLGTSSEMDATIIEVAFHDSVEDAALMRDPKVRDQLARSTYEGTLEYFDVWGGLNTPVATASAPINVRAVSNASGEVTLSWSAGPTGVHGGAATGFRIYASSNGYGFDGGKLVAGGGTTAVTFSGYDPTLPYYFKIVAVNAGGESKGSEVLAVVPNGGAQRVLIVNGFDRLERTQNFRYAYAHVGDGLVDRVWSRYNNSFDYSVQLATAIHAKAPNVRIDSTSNEAVISGAVNLNNYDAVMWILGEESTSTRTFDATEQSKVAAYLAQGGKLFLSGSEIAWDLGAQGGGAAFLNNTLKATYVADDANAYNVTGTAASIFAGLSFSFSNGSQFSNLTSQTYNVDAPDRINPMGGAIVALNYPSGAGAAGIQYANAGNGSQIVMLAFPFETITTAANRAAVMERVLAYFVLNEVPTEMEFILDNDSGPGVYSETGTWETATATGYNGLTYRFASTGTAATATWQFYAPFAGHAELYVQHRAGSNRADNAAFSINTGSGVESASVNQKTDLLVWVPLGEFYFQEGVRTITLNAQTSTGGSVVLADAIRVVLFNAPPPTGDFNDDGLTDGTDFLVWQRNVSKAAPELSDGDGNGDRSVDGDDLALWAANFGSQTAAVQGASLAAVSASLMAEPGSAHSLALLDDMAAIAQRVAASAALERYGVRKSVEREVAIALADDRRRLLDANPAIDLAFLRRTDVEQLAPRGAGREAARPDAARGTAGLDRALERHDVGSWRHAF